jgi:hypothetical protein
MKETKNNNENNIYGGYCERHKEFFDYYCRKCFEESQKTTFDERVKWFKEFGEHWDKEEPWSKYK